MNTNQVDPSEHRDPPGNRLITALQMHDEGVSIMRTNLKFQFPKKSAREREQILNDWVLGKPIPLKG